MVMASSEEEKPIQEVLAHPILLADRVIRSAEEAESFKAENLALIRQVTHLSELLRSAARLTSAAVYDRPIRRVSLDVVKSLDRAGTLARKFRHKKTNVLHHVLSITTTADFKKISVLFDSSIADIKWVLSIFSQDPSDYQIALPPFAGNDPILAWVWPAVAAVHMGRAEAAQELAFLAHNDSRHKKIIVEENGIPPLLKMLKESSNIEGQSAAASALCNLADDAGRVKNIASNFGVQIIAKALAKAPARVQLILVDLVSKMSEIDPTIQEEFGRENVTRPLVTLLAMDMDLDPPEVKSRLKISCAAALCILAKQSLSNSTKITDTKALLVLAKIIEEEQGDLKMNCLKSVMELAAVAESNPELKRAAFKPTSTAARLVLEQLIKVINKEANASMVITAVKAIGCLASIFPAKEKHIVQSLVEQLDHRSSEVAAEAAKALSKFVCEDNYNRREHAEAIMEVGGVQRVMSLVRRKEGEGVHVHVHVHEVVLVCNLAINGGIKAMEQGRALRLLEGAARNAVAHHPHLTQLFAKAIQHLTIYQPANHAHTHH